MRQKLIQSVLVCHDQPLVRLGWAYAISQTERLQLDGEVGDTAALLEKLAELRPDLLVTEIVIGNRLCLDVMEDVQRRFPQTRILIVSRQPEEVIAERTIRAGCGGYLGGTATLSDFREAVSNVMRSEVYLSKNIQEQIVMRSIGRADRNSRGNPLGLLSDRELRIFILFGSGAAPREIANELDLSVKTIETYRERLKEKLCLKSSFELLRFALECQVFGAPHFFGTNDGSKKKMSGPSRTPNTKRGERLK